MRAPRHLRARAVVAAALLAVVVLVIASFIVLDRDDDVDAQDTGVPAMQWPAFTMTYSEYQTDVASGQVRVDRTWNLRVEDDYTWRAELIRDALNPEEVGSVRAFNNGVYTNYHAMLRHTNTQKEIKGTEAITMELSPVMYAHVRAGRYLGQGFIQTSSPDGTYVATRSEGGIVERIEFSTAHIRDGASGGITTSYTRHIDGVLNRRLTVESLTLD